MYTMYQEQHRYITTGTYTYYKTHTMEIEYKYQYQYQQPYIYTSNKQITYRIEAQLGIR